jgi:hypothetical protein
MLYVGHYLPLDPIFASILASMVRITAGRITLPILARFA